MVRIVVGPHEIVVEVVALGEIEAGLVLLEGGEAVRAVVVAGQALQLGPHPEVMLLVGLVHRLQQPRHPADAGLDGGEAQSLGKRSSTPEAQRLATGSMVGDSECET